MCDACGCEHGHEKATITVPGAATPGHDDHHEHCHDPGHEHGHGDEVFNHRGSNVSDHGRRLRVEREVLGRNDQLAAHNREHFRQQGILALNLVSSPGSGKTTLLERTIRELQGQRPLAVIEGDQQTLLDAERIQQAGAPVVQVNTGAGCHLDAEMIHRALHRLNPAPGSLLFIENVGNLVCPAMFDLGEAAKVVVISVTEGEDKPLKYPAMFAAAGICLINKIDLLPHVDFSLEKCGDYARRANPDLLIFPLSARTGEGMDGWLAWLTDRP